MSEFNGITVLLDVVVEDEGTALCPMCMDFMHEIPKKQTGKEMFDGPMYHCQSCDLVLQSLNSEMVAQRNLQQALPIEIQM